MTHPGTPGNADPPWPPLAGPAAGTPAPASPAPGGEHEFALPTECSLMGPQRTVASSA